MNLDIKNKVPIEVTEIIRKLQLSGFRSQLVGGSVRDLFLNKIPKDWDINTNAKPEEIIKIFPDSFYENEFGTVGVKIRKTDSHETDIVEITPYRKEGAYKDGRHPSSVSFEATLYDDLSRRDFTVNAIAYDPISNITYTPYTENHQVTALTELSDSISHLKDIDLSFMDLGNKVIRTVGKANDRFEEDFLRMIRAIRLATQLGFSIEKQTELSIIELSSKLVGVSRERVRDELTKIVMSDNPMVGLLMLDYTGLLKDIMPELLLGKGMYQTKNHAHDVFPHLLRSMQHAADKGYSLELRLAALLHDIAKPHTCKWVESSQQNSFHGHEVLGEKVSREILNRLKFPQEVVSRVTKLVRWHMFNSDPDQVTMSAVRRMIINVGRENIWDLMNLRYCDRIGSGRPVEEPYRLRRYFAMIEEALTQPTDLGMLKIDGNTVMEVTRETPGPRIGHILNAVMGEVLENPSLNTEEWLVSRVTELAKLEDHSLKILALKGREGLDEEKKEQSKVIRKKFKVQ
jgi:putative nucleotidyltransferase with HDIG domain